MDKHYRIQPYIFELKKQHEAWLNRLKTSVSSDLDGLWQDKVFINRFPLSLTILTI